MPCSTVGHVWQKFAQDCNVADTRDELLSIFTGAMSGLGFDRVNVSLMRDFDMPDAELGFGLVNTYPEDW
jgi:hypothetical protein